MDKEQYRKRLNDLHRQDWANPGKKYAPESRVRTKRDWTKEEDIRYWSAQITLILKSHYGLSLQQVATLLGVKKTWLWNALQIYKKQEYSSVEECTRELRKYHNLNY